MSKKRNAVRDSIAIRDFGTTNIPFEVRGLARKIASEKGCTPLEALPEAKMVIEIKKQERKEVAKLAKAYRKAKRTRKKVNRSKKGASVGRPTFNGEVQGGSPGLGKRKS